MSNQDSRYYFFIYLLRIVTNSFVLIKSALATYNSLIDPHLQCYFSNERIRSHLKHAGLVKSIQ